MTLNDLIATGSGKMGITLTNTQIHDLARFHDMLIAANRVMNLTRVSDDLYEAVDRNYLDSLAPLGIPGLFSDVNSLIDVGSGAGFPGIPLAIARPDIRITMVDALGKRIKFINEVIQTLNLNANAIHMRSEDAGRDPSLRAKFDCATARAVAGTNVLLELCLPFVKTGGMMIAYKGPSLEEELTTSKAALSMLGGRIRTVFPVIVPERDWTHQLLVVDKINPTPGRYPRKAGEPGRNPL